MSRPWRRVGCGLQDSGQATATILEMMASIREQTEKLFLLMDHRILALPAASI